MELYLERSRFREIGWAEMKPKGAVSGRAQGVGLRAVRAGRQGFAYAREISPASVRSLWERARGLAGLMPRDPHRALRSYPRPRGEALAADGTLFRSSAQDLRSRLAGFEKALLSSDRRIKKALRLSFRESAGAAAVVSTEGVAGEDASSAVDFAVELMGESRGEAQVSWDSMETRFWRDMEPDRALAGARDRLFGSFNARPVPSGTWPVIFPPRVGVELMDLAADALSAEAVQRGRSFLAGRRGRRAGSAQVTWIDDPRRPDGVASALHDAEGCPTRSAVLLDRGVLKDFLYDGASAAREGRAGSGNAGRPGPEAPPAPEPSNFYMAPGRSTVQDLMAVPRALWVQDVMGMHTADPVSGDFSVGAAGLLVQRGRAVRPAKGFTIAGNLLDLFKNVDAVAGDLTWYGAAGAPTFRVSGLSIGGS